jgi:hypothetical protein
MAGIAQQADAEVVLGDELLVLFGRIRATAENYRIQAFEIGNAVRELTGFGSATRGVVLRVEVQNHPVALQIRQRHNLLVLVREPERWRLLAFLNPCWAHVSSIADFETVELSRGAAIDL